MPSLDLALLLAQLLVVLALARLFGAAALRVGQPRATGEILAGLALGPSLLGALAPRAHHALFPADGLVPLQALSQLGVLLFLFVVGLRLDLAALRGHARTAVVASHASIVAPLLMGMAVATSLPRALAGPNGAALPFGLFVGTALSVTAFPVLATIVAERGLEGTRLGALALTAAAVDDVTAWALLAGVVALARANGGWGALAITLGGAALAVAAAFAMRPLVAWAASRAALRRDPARAFLPLALAFALALAWATERAGVHALFGAFLAGTLVPRARGLATAVADRLADPVGVLLLPTFFASTGLRTTLAFGDGAGTGRALLALLLVAVAGKLGAAAVASRLAGERWRDALALGALLNTRGLMALVVVGVGLDAGVIAPELHGLMVLVALLTTMMTTPLLTLLGYGVGARRAAVAPPHAGAEPRAG